MGRQRIPGILLALLCVTLWGCTRTAPASAPPPVPAPAPPTPAADPGEQPPADPEADVLSLFRGADTPPEDTDRILRILPYVDWRRYEQVSQGKTMELLEWVYGLELQEDEQIGLVLRSQTNLDGAYSEMYAVIVGSFYRANPRQFIRVLADQSLRLDMDRVSSALAYEVYGPERTRVRAELADLLPTLAPAEQAVAKQIMQALERTDAGPDASRAVQPFPPPTLTYYTLGRETELPIGQVQEVTRPDFPVRLRFAAPVKESDVQRHLRVTPVERLSGSTDWFDGFGNNPGPMLQIMLKGLALGETVTVQLRAGLTAPGHAGLDGDFVWVIRRVAPTTASVSVQGPGMVQYLIGPFYVAPVPYDTGSVVAINEGLLTLDLRFSGPVNQAAVEADLRRSLHPAPDLTVDWLQPERAIATAHLAFAWNRPGFIFLEELPDAQGLPIQVLTPIQVKVERWRTLYRWTPDGGNIAAGQVLATHDPLPAGNLVGPGGLILWHTIGDDGIAYIRAPWLIRLDTGVSVPVGPALTHVHHLQARWLPDGQHIAINAGNRVDLMDTAGRLVTSLTTDSPEPGFFMGMAVHPADGRIAVFEAWYPEIQGYGVIDLVIFDGSGRVAARLPGVSLLRTTEGFPLPVDAEWLPDGRVAFTRYVAEPGAEVPVARLALADLAAGQVHTTPVAANQITGMAASGLLVVDGWEKWSSGFSRIVLYDPTTDRTRTAPQPHPNCRIGPISPDGDWLAAEYGEPLRVGVLPPGADSWMPIGRGTLVGWGPDGELYWLGEPDYP